MKKWKQVPMNAPSLFCNHSIKETEKMKHFSQFVFFVCIKTLSKNIVSIKVHNCICVFAFVFVRSGNPLSRAYLSSSNASLGISAKTLSNSVFCICQFPPWKSGNEKWSNPVKICSPCQWSEFHCLLILFHLLSSLKPISRILKANVETNINDYMTDV